MSTERQVSANRSNAQKSTGPTSAQGKAASSLNARRHGLTGALDEGVVLSWYQVILDNEAADLNNFEQEPYFRAAADLARTEAHLQRVRMAEERWLRDREAPLTEGEKTLESTRALLLGTATEFGWDRMGLRLLERMDRTIQQSRVKAQRNHESLGRTLARYRASAEARRRAALQCWITEITRRSQT